MKYKILTAILFFSFFVPSYAGAQGIDVYSRPLRSERSHDFDVLHYRIELRLEEATKSLWGKTTVILLPLTSDFTSCVLDARSFVVDKVEAEQPLEFEHADGKLTVHLAKPADYGQRISFTVTYHATNLDVDGATYGLSSSYDLGLDFKDETPDNPPHINTMSWPEGARHWFPCYDHPNDRATHEVIATVRDDYKVLSNGRLVSVTDGAEPGTQTWHWSQTLAHPTYLTMLAAGPYVVIEDSLGDLPINYWVYEKDEADALRSFHKTPEIIAFFNEEFGYTYPWAKYDQVTVARFGGGAESTSATILGQSTIHDARAEQDFPSHGLVAHEAAHQWWGDLVSYRAWSETWVSESFATYSEYLWSKHDLGEEEGAVNLLRKKNSYLREAHTRYMRPIVFHRWNYANENFDAHTYPKGAAILHMLRWIMGDDAFRRTIAHFLHENAFQPASSHDFMKSIKEATGQNMDGFIEQWIFRPGHPVFDVSYDWNDETKKLHVRVRQTQDTTGETPVYKTPIVIGVHTVKGKASKRFSIEKKDEVLTLDVEEKPLLVRFDEGNYLLKEWTFNKTTDELLYQLRRDDVIGRAWAASELLGQGEDSRTIPALIEAGRTDSFWSVRQAAIETIGKLDGEGQIDLLKESTQDPNSKVRVASLAALGDTGRTELTAFLEARFEADDSYLAQAEALRSIGKTGDGNTIGFLEKAQKIPSPRDVLGRAATEALGRIRK